MLESCGERKKGDSVVVSGTRENTENAEGGKGKQADCPTGEVKGVFSSDIDRPVDCLGDGRMFDCCNGLLSSSVSVWLFGTKGYLPLLICCGVATVNHLIRTFDLAWVFTLKALQLLSTKDESQQWFFYMNLSP